MSVAGSGLDKLVSSLSDLKVRLESRKKVSPAVFSENMKLREETHHLGMTLLSLLLIFFFYLKEPFYLVIHREVNKPIKSLSGSSCILYNNGCTWCLFHQFFVGFDSYSTMRLLIQCTGEDGA